MGSIAPEQQYWVIEPLLAAGLDPDEIADLLVRLGFDTVVGDGPGTLARLTEVVEGRPPVVRAAWIETIDRMLAGDDASPA
ncbi:hypothetical protein ACI797_24740 [Geodermatophilus sp. SYSU D00691]